MFCWKFWSMLLIHWLSFSYMEVYWNSKLCLAWDVTGFLKIATSFYLVYLFISSTFHFWLQFWMRTGIVLMCILVPWTNYYELLWAQVMLWMHWSQIYKIPTVYYRVGIRLLLILAHGSMSPVTVRIVSLECKLLSLLGARNKSLLGFIIMNAAPQSFPFYLTSDLGNANLSGTLVPQLGDLHNLQYLWVFINFCLYWSFFFLILHLDYISLSLIGVVVIEGIYRSSFLVFCFFTFFPPDQGFIFI